MNTVQIIRAVDTMRAEFRDRLNGNLPEPAPLNENALDCSPEQMQAHLLDMLNKIELMVGTPEKREKLMRWLGFIQGSLFTDGVYTLKELKDMNRARLEDDPEFIEAADALGEYQPDLLGCGSADCPWCGHA